MEIKGLNSHNIEWILSIIELDLYCMIICLCESNASLVFKRYCLETIFTEIKGHNSDNNQWILSIIEFNLYFMITYLCMKDESDTWMFSKDITPKPSFYGDQGL